MRLIQNIEFYKNIREKENYIKNYDFKIQATLYTVRQTYWPSETRILQNGLCAHVLFVFHRAML